jgi:hypothetical protein
VLDLVRLKPWRVLPRGSDRALHAPCAADPAFGA